MTYSKHRVHVGDNLDLLRSLPDNSVDAVVTDPPYGLGEPPDAVAMLRDWVNDGHHDQQASRGFMGRTWDATVPQPALWREVFRVLKPGGHLVAFFGTRTYDVGTLAIRLAGFEIRDCLFWCYGSGMPKGLDIGKGIDKAAGVEREVVGPGINAAAKMKHGGTWTGGVYGSEPAHGSGPLITAPATEAARQWDGWNTQIKPSVEPIVLARKPLSESSIVANVLRWGTGGVNVGACRVETHGDRANEAGGGQGAGYDAHNKPGRKYGNGLGGVVAEPHEAGRFPPNLIHDGSAEAVAGMPESSSGALSPRHRRTTPKSRGDIYSALPGCTEAERPASKGSAARYFYSAKASQKERAGSKHPTVKPLSLMRWLARLVTPPGGVVLDPFLGSGTTLLAAEAEGFTCIGAELEHGDDIAIRWAARAAIVAASDAAQAQKDKSVDPAPYRGPLFSVPR
jgi:site-specific DNA-methyltransferase (adenine-specific)